MGFEALLVALSPHDSIPAAWASTLLTTALVIAAMIQKFNQDLTLHHAVLILKSVLSILRKIRSS